MVALTKTASSHISGRATPGEGSVTIARLQQKLGVTADGLCGKDTINALIKRYQSVSGATVLDGKLDAASVTVKAMQRALNEGRL